MTIRTTTLLGTLLLAAAVLASGLSCSKKETAADGNDELKKLIQRLEATKEPYKGNLNPEKAAEITHRVSQQSMSEIPVNKQLPKDPKDLMAMNDRIRKNTDKIYAQYGTTMKDVMNYISDLSPKDRERYNTKLTDLFLASSRKAYHASEPAAESAGTTPAAQTP